MERDFISRLKLSIESNSTPRFLITDFTGTPSKETEKLKDLYIMILDPTVIL